MLARPDPNTFELAAVGAATTRPSARMFCDIANLDGTPFEGDPRHVLRATSTAAREQGFSFFAAPEMEFFYFADGDPTHAARAARHRRRTSTSPPPTWPATCASARSTRSRTWASRSSTPTTRTRPSQHEIDLRYTDALTMADTVMTFRLVVKEIAQRARRATPRSCPSRSAGVQGSGMHTHISLFEGDTNAFHDPGDEYGLSKVGQGASSPACCTTPARSPPSPTSGSTPTSG